MTAEAPADALLDEVRAAMRTLSGLLGHETDLGDAVAAGVRAALEEVRGRLARSELRVAVVGEPRAGKSTLLDAMLGARLLGMTRTPAALISVRRGSERKYRAKFASGAVEDFERRVPDRRPGITRQIEAAEAASRTAKRRCDDALAELTASAEAVGQAEHALTEAFRAFEEAREDAARLDGEFEAAEQARERLEVDVVERETALPRLLRTLPPWWALWLWVLWVFAWLFTWRAFRAHRALLPERDHLEDEVMRLRAETTQGATRCATLETAFAAASGPVEKARAALVEARRLEGAAAAEWEATERAARERRGDMEREEEERARRFTTEVGRLCDPESRGRELTELDIEYPARFLPDDIVMIEAPGAAAEAAELAERAWRAIEEQADGCILVSELEHAVSGPTIGFLKRLRDAVPHAILVLTKMDEPAKTEEQVEQARRIGTRRFARELGRDPASALSLAVAAEQALREAEEALPARRRFESDMVRLFTLLRREKALILGARSAAIVRRCIGGVAEAEARAVSTYERRILALEADRIPDPDRFREEHLATAEPALAAATKGVVTSALGALHENADLVRVACTARIAACKKDDLGALASELGSTISAGLATARHDVRAHLDSEADRAVRELEAETFRALRARYHLLHEVTRESKRPVRVDAEVHDTGTIDLGPRIHAAMRSFDRFRVGFGVGGAAAAAAVGTLVLPGIGTAAGAVVGGLATFARTFGSLKRDCLSATNEAILGLEGALADQVRAAEPAVAAAIRMSLDRSLQEASTRFARWIAEPLEAEREAIERERGKLADLQTLRRRLEEHDIRLAALGKTAADASVGLCR